MIGQTAINPSTENRNPALAVDSRGAAPLKTSPTAEAWSEKPRFYKPAVSPLAKRGHVDHTYADHASILKFIEWNWSLQPLSSRSRDNLPNPISSPNGPYFPTNSPAIGDLRTMFEFGPPPRP